MNEELKIGREPVTVVEIYQASCSKTNGVGACEANQPTPCYNTKKTCQFTQAYDTDKTIVWRFTKAAALIDDYFEIDGVETKTFAIPSLVSSTTSPSIINVAGAGQNTSALGKRATFSGTFQDMPYNDQFSDKYVIARSYNPQNQGTFWGKFLARNPYYQNSRVVVYDGYRGMALADMLKREYLLDKIDINSTGIVTVTAKDPLRLADDKRSLAPPASDLQIVKIGVTSLADFSDTDTALTVNCSIDDLAPISGTRYLFINNELITFTGYSAITGGFLLSGVSRGASNTSAQSINTDDLYHRVSVRLVSGEVVEYTIIHSSTIYVKGNVDDLSDIGISSLRYTNISDEIISFTGYLAISDYYSLSGVVRAQFFTVAEDHEKDDKLQRLLRYEDAEFQNVVNDLLVNYTPLDNTNNQFWNLELPYAGSWKEEYDEYLSGFTFTGTITKPTSVNKALANICQQGNFYIWWNDRAAQIEFKTVRPSNAIPTLLNDDFNLRDGMAVKTKPEDRYSRAVIYYGQRNPLLNVDDTLNYAGVYIRVDADSEQDTEYGESRTKNIYANFLSDDSFTTTLGTTFVQRFRDNPQFMNISVDAKDGALWTGDIVDINTRNVQNADGSNATGRWQIISAEESVSGEIISYMLQNFVFVGNFGSWMADDALNYLDTPEDNRATGMWWSDDNGNMSNGDTGYKWQ